MNKNKHKKSKGADKQDEAHFKNVFSQKVIEIARAVTENDSYKLLTPDILSEIFLFRSKSMRFVADESLQFSSIQLKMIKEQVLDFLKSRNHTFSTTGRNVSLYYFAGPGLSLLAYLFRADDKKQGKFLKINEAFKYFRETEELLRDLQISIYRVTNFIDWEFTWPSKRIVSSNISFKTAHESPPYLYIEVRFNAFQPETVLVKHKGETLTAYKVVIPTNGFDPVHMKIQPDFGQSQTKANDRPIPVYIEQHALDQLREKITCNESRAIYLSLISSLDRAKCFFYHGKLLIEFKFVFVKIGYLLANVISGKAIIHGFTFLTHADTPEGDNLQMNVIEARANISCLDLDNINTFLYSFVDKNSLLYHLMKQSGCSSLFNIPRSYFEKGLEIKMEAINEYMNHYNEHREQISFKELVGEGL